MKGLFGDLFDLNKDGKMSFAEIAAEAQFFDRVRKKNSENKEKKEYAYVQVDENWIGCFDIYSTEGWDMMDEDERIERLERAGLDPREYKLEIAGIDPADLNFLLDDEKMKILEEAGLELSDDELEALGIDLDELENPDDELGDLDDEMEDSYDELEDSDNELELTFILTFEDDEESNDLL